MLEEKFKLKIINDLARKKPKGPLGVKKPESEYRNIGDQKVLTWGYEPEQIFSLGFHSQMDIIRYFSPTGPPSSLRSKAHLRRRASMIWDRIAPVISEIEKQGIVGIYKISEYGVGLKHSIRGYLWADCKETAQFLGETVFRGIAGANSYISVIPFCYGGPETLRELNSNLIASIEKKIKHRKSQISIYEKYVDEKEKMVEIIKQSSESFYQASHEAVANFKEK